MYLFCHRLHELLIVQGRIQRACIGSAVYKYGVYFLMVGSVDHKLILCKNRILLLTCTTELKIIHFFLFLEGRGVSEDDLDLNNSVLI